MERVLDVKECKVSENEKKGINFPVFGWKENWKQNFWWKLTAMLI